MSRTNLKIDSLMPFNKVTPAILIHAVYVLRVLSSPNNIYRGRNTPEQQRRAGVSVWLGGIGHA